MTNVLDLTNPADVELEENLLAAGVEYETLGDRLRAVVNAERASRAPLDSVEIGDGAECYLQRQLDGTVRMCAGAMVV